MLKTLLRICIHLLSKLFKTDEISDKFPVSIKAILIDDEKVLFLKNERNEWDLPGGKIIFGENPRDCLVREVKEETNLEINDLKIHESICVKINGVYVFLVLYKATISSDNHITKSYEHSDYNFYSKLEISKLNTPTWYKEVVMDLL